MKNRLDTIAEPLEDLTRQLADVNRRLEEAEAFKGNFLSNIRNEILNPLTAILGLSAQIMNGEVRPDAISGHASMIHQEAFNLDFQLNNICMAAELEAGEAVPFLTRIDVSGILESIILSLEHLRHDKDAAVELSLPDNTLFDCDAGMFHLIAVNLLDNALRFCDPGTLVQAHVTFTDDSMTLSICSRGPVLRPEDFERIFDRFSQLDSGRCKSHTGHGLGLSVVCALAEQLGGSIALTTPARHECLVTVTLPRPELPEAAMAREGNLIMFDNLELF